MTTPETASNFLLVTMDSVRRDYLGCYGGSENSTPHIDALSRTSLVFDQAITNGSYTKTAFPPILSSTYASSHSGPFADVGRERPMLASVLKDHGFATAGFTANPLLGAHLGYDAGFDRFEEPVPPPDSRRWLRLRGAQRVLRSSLLNSLLRQAGVETRPHPVYVDGSRITDSALEWLQYQNGRFFLWVHYMDAHWPYHVPAELRHGGACAQAWRDLQIMNRNRKSYPGDAVVARIKALYRSGISRLDREVGRLLDYLDTTGRLSQTVVAVTADHGEAFYEHGRWQHGAYLDFHEEIIRVPLVIHLPGLNQPRRIADQVTLLDLAPTALQVLGVPAGPQMQGRSLLGRNCEMHPLPIETAITEMIEGSWWAISMRTPEFKYIYDERHPHAKVLYNLKKDPGETSNCWGQYPGIEAQFEKELSAHLERVAREAGQTAGHWRTSPEVLRRLKALGYVE